MFIDKFDTSVCDGDTIVTKRGKWTITATVVFDEASTIDDDDMHNPNQLVTGCTDYEFERLMAARKAWFNNEWYYCGIVLSVSYNGKEIDDHAASLWAIDANYPGSDNGYLTDVANELIDEAIEHGEKQRKHILKALKA